MTTPYGDLISLDTECWVKADDPPGAALCAGIDTLDPLLRERRTLNLYADRSLVVRGVAGWRALLEDGAAPIGQALVESAPELEGHALELKLMAAGEMDRLDLGLCTRRTGSFGVRFVWSSLYVCRQAESALGLVYSLQEANALGERWERLERQRRELFDLRQAQARLNLELALAQSELRRLDDAKTKFVSAAAHELRNPLASLMGYIELLELEAPENLSATQRQYIGGLTRSVQRLRTLTNNLLDIPRLDSNRLELMLTSMDALTLVEQAVEEMQPLFDLKKQRVVLRAEPSLPQIWCDRTRAMQILTNLLSNAYKYTPQGGSVTVSVGRQRNRPFLLLRVKDTGVGIPPDEQYQLFNRFYRASNAGAADGSGAGLGLAITQSLVKLHGGKIWFESKLGKGATFHVTFPIVA